jgi:hypothetical protein
MTTASLRTSISSRPITVPVEGSICSSAASRVPVTTSSSGSAANAAGVISADAAIPAKPADCRFLPDYEVKPLASRVHPR